MILRALAATGLVLATGTAPLSVVAPTIEAIPRTGASGRDPALVLVYVVDQDGIPLEGIEVSVRGTRTPMGTVKTVKDGTALLRIADAGRVTVRASGESLVAAEARGVQVKRGGLTAVALPLATVADE